MANEKLEILYRDDYFVIINKPSGMLVHPGQGGDYYAPNVLKILKKQISRWLYPIHRLDRPTSGILIMGLDKEMSSELMKKWENTQKHYYALVCGDYRDNGEFTFALKAKDKIDRDTGEVNDVWQDAHTIYKPIKQFQGEQSIYTFCDIEILTGRMHQIRRHFARVVTPLAGDTKYGKGKFNNELREKFNLHRLFLHCYKMSFIHPVTNEKIEINCELPEELQFIYSNNLTPLS